MSVRIDASGDRLDRASVAVLDYNSTYTASMWVRFNSLPASGNWETVFAINDTTTQYCDALRVRGSDSYLVLYVESDTGSTEVAVSSGALSTGVWYFVGIRRTTNASAKGFIQAATVGDTLTIGSDNTRACSGRTASDTMSLGALDYNSSWGEEIDGRISTFKAWQASLSDSQVKHEAWSVVPRKTGDLFMWTPIWPGATERIIDYGPNGYDWANRGTLTDEAGPPVTMGWYRSLYVPDFPAEPADVKVAVGRAAISTSGNIQHFTIPGFGTPKAAMFLWTISDTNDTPALHASMGAGITDGVNDHLSDGAWERYITSSSEDGQDNVDAARAGGTSCIRVWGGNSEDDAWGDFNAWVPDGIQIRWNGNPTTDALLTYVLFGGDDLTVKVGQFNHPAGAGNFTDVDVGFEPDQVIALCSGTGFTHSGGNDAHLCFGFADNGDSIVQAAHVWTDDHLAAAGGASGVIKNNRLAINMQRGNGTVSRACEVTSFNAGPTPAAGFTATTRDAGQNFGNDVAYLALHYNGAIDHSVEFIDTPTTTTGNNSITGIGFQPQFVMELLTKHSAYGSGTTGYNTDVAAVQGVSVFDADSEYCVSVAIEDAAVTTNTQSVSNDKVIDLDDHDGTGLFEADFVSMDTGGWTRNFTATDTVTVRKGAALAIGAVAVPATTRPVPIRLGPR